MKIGIDISQAVYEGTGVGRYVVELTKSIIGEKTDHTFVLFGSSYGRYEELLRTATSLQCIASDRVTCKLFHLPLSIFDVLWNRFHMFPIEWFIGPVDIFWSSDWVQPPLQHAVGITTIHDVSFLHFPESFDQHIMDVHKRRLTRVVSECKKIFCDSEATKTDINKLLHIPLERLDVIYPGFRL